MRPPELIEEEAHTNEEIRRKKTENPNSEWYKNPTNNTGVKERIGFSLLTGATKSSDVSLVDIFLRQFGLPVFRCVTFKNRFEFLLSRLRFDSKETREERKRTDKFVASREVWIIFIVNATSEYLTIYEILFNFSLIKNTNLNITDNLFSSNELEDELIKPKITYVINYILHLAKNKREMPFKIVAVKGLPPMTSRFVYRPDKMLIFLL